MPYVVRVGNDVDASIRRRADMKLLGVHLIGKQARDLIPIGMMAMLSDSRAMIFQGACVNVPTQTASKEFSSSTSRSRTALTQFAWSTPAATSSVFLLKDFSAEALLVSVDVINTKCRLSKL